jgi:transcriptional regulator with GAF, ATPase, and Fis domain
VSDHPPRATWRSIREAGDKARRASEAGAILRALTRARWSLAGAARSLEVDVETLTRYLRRRHPELLETRRRMADRERC